MARTARFLPPLPCLAAPQAGSRRAGTGWRNKCHQCRLWNQGLGVMLSTSRNGCRAECVKVKSPLRREEPLRSYVLQDETIRAI